jgi:hypothetical protein
MLISGFSILLSVCKLEYEGVCLRNNFTSSFCITTIIICFDLRPSSGGTNIEYTNRNFAKLPKGPLLEHWLLDELVRSCVLYRDVELGCMCNT